MLTHQDAIELQIQEYKKKAEALTKFAEKSGLLGGLLKECLEITEGSELQAQLKESIANMVWGSSSDRPVSSEKISKSRKSRGSRGLTTREEVAIKKEIKEFLGIEGNIRAKHVTDRLFDKCGAEADELIEALQEESAIASESKDWSKFWSMAKEGVDKLRPPAED